jgi:hypothetical protein
MQGDTSFFILFGACHFGAAQASGYHDFDAFCAASHGGGDGAFHGATESYTSFYLFCYRCAY